jgi:metal-sulfur cluster biosynthetic enzyme
MNPNTLTEENVLDVLRQVIDPEIGCNIVDLGLVYRVAFENGVVTVTMTLTTPGCPMHESICDGVRNVLLSIDGVLDVEVNLVWDPPWNPGLMTDEGRKAIGVTRY